MSPKVTDVGRYVGTGVLDGPLYRTINICCHCEGACARGNLKPPLPVILSERSESKNLRITDAAKKPFGAKILRRASGLLRMTNRGTFLLVGADALIGPLCYGIDRSNIGLDIHFLSQAKEN